MDKNYENLKQCYLFKHMKETDLKKIQYCLGGRIVKYSKNQVIFQEGDLIKDMSIVISGAVQMVRDDYNGNRMLIGRLNPGDLFAESVAILEKAQIPLTIIAENDCEILLLDRERVMNPCWKNCFFHIHIIKNLLYIIAAKNIWYAQRIEITSCRTTRDKIMAYLIMEANYRGEREFTIPYNRQQLADFLCVERSAMSAEISKLKADGIIECSRSWFRLL